MSGLPFGSFKKPDPAAFIPEASVQEQNEFLASDDYIFCEKMDCKMREKYCLKNQDIAYGVVTGWANSPFSRVGCMGCELGSKIAAKHKVKFNKKAS